jgi:hypothetical protein
MEVFMLPAIVIVLAALLVDRTRAYRALPAAMSKLGGGTGIIRDRKVPS